MATNVTEIISQALIFIDDVRLTELLQVSPARFYRKMSAYVQAAMPMLNRPPELFSYISSEYVEPEFTSDEWTSTYESVGEETIYTTEAIGYDLCSITVRSDDGQYETPYTDFTYDSETGEITFGQQTQKDLMYEIDFYKDGSFADLSLTMMRLFALAVTCVWNDRFNNNWLNMQMKIHDSSFDTVNESNYVEKMTVRNKEMKQAFASELHKYEQDVAYNRTIPRVFKTKPQTLI